MIICKLQCCRCPLVPLGVMAGPLVQKGGADGPRCFTACIFLFLLPMPLVLPPPVMVPRAAAAPCFPIAPLPLASCASTCAKRASAALARLRRQSDLRCALANCSAAACCCCTSWCRRLELSDSLASSSAASTAPQARKIKPRVLRNRGCMDRQACRQADGQAGWVGKTTRVIV